MRTEKLYAIIARALDARANCLKSGNDEWFEKHGKRIRDLTRDFMPSGSGFNNGTTFDFDASTEARLVFNTSYHHMNEVGCYDGWSSHTVTVRPSLAFEFDLRIGGRDRNGIKDYIAHVFRSALQEDLIPPQDEQSGYRRVDHD